MFLSCACSPLVLKSTTGGRNFEIIQFIHQKKDGLSADQFQGVQMNDIPILEDLLTLNILLYDFDIVDGNIFGVLARRSVQKCEKTVQLLRYKNHKCHNDE